MTAQAFTGSVFGRLEPDAAGLVGPPQVVAPLRLRSGFGVVPTE